MSFKLTRLRQEAADERVARAVGVDERVGGDGDDGEEAHAAADGDRGRLLALRDHDGARAAAVGLGQARDLLVCVTMV